MLLLGVFLAALAALQNAIVSDAFGDADRF